MPPSGQIALPASGNDPRAVSAVFTPRLDGGTPPATTVSTRVACSRRSDGWRCALPAGVFDIEFQADGRLPDYRWDVAVTAGTVRTLPALDLRAGTALSGLVRDERGSALEGCELRASPKPLAAARRRRAVPTRFLHARTNARGFFRVELPPGDYDVRAACGDLRSAPVPAVAGERGERRLAPLVARPPQPFEVQVQPGLDPWGRTWRVVLENLFEPSEGLDPGPPVEDGLWRGAVAPDRYRLFVRDSHGSAWDSRDVVVSQSTSIDVSLASVRVTGLVTLAGRPLFARLVFRHAGRRLRLDTTYQGRFDTFLPADVLSAPSASWTVSVGAREPAVRRVLELRIDPSPADGTARVDIDLPERGLRGRVLTELGVPVSDERVRVSVRGLGTVASTLPDVSLPLTPPDETDVDGAPAPAEFALAGLEAGSYVLKAEGRQGVSEEREVNAIGPDDVDVELRLAPVVRVSVQLESPQGLPVGGAALRATPIGREVGDARAYRSDDDGLVQLELPRGTVELGLQLAADGYGVQLLRRAAGDRETLVLTLAPPAAELRLLSRTAVEPTSVHGLRAYLLASHFAADMEELRDHVHKPAAAGDEIVVARLVAGAYRACLLTAGEMSDALLGAVPAERCTPAVTVGEEAATLSLLEIERRLLNGRRTD